MAEKKLTKKDVIRAYFDWIMFALSCQNMERMEAPALVRMMARVIHKLYDDVEEKKKVLLRHTHFFNTQPLIGSMIPGIVLGMEEQKANDSNISEEMIIGVKAALMGPFAGIGDSLMVGTYIPILLSIALGLSGESGSLLGPIFYAVAYLGVMFPLTWFLFNTGYKTGLTAAQSILSGGIKDKINKAINIVGLTVVGAISAQYVKAKIGLIYSSGQMQVDLLKSLEGIFPSLIPMLLTLLSWYLMDKKNMKIGKVFLIFAIMAAVATFTKILVP